MSFVAVTLWVVSSAEAPMVRIPAGPLKPFLLESGGRRDAGEPKLIDVPAFSLDVRQVTRGEFLEFVRANPQWRRSRVARIFADPSYLASWGGDLELPQGSARAPVTEVSWFAANAYCRSRAARLPTTAQWERAADDDGASTPMILEWYARPSKGAVRDAGSGAPNRFGVRDLHGLVWEWVLDFNQATSADDTRSGNAGDAALYCGAGAGNVADPKDYTAFMRYAFRDSLKASYTVKDLGFRCAGPA